jgi:HK97 family phage prohead protease
MSTFIRAFPLEDISIVSRAKGGDGRTVEAYAAVFDRAVPIRDHQGEYEEVIAPGSFRKTLAERGNNFGVFYNHARGIHGQPSDLFSIPIGVPVDVREDMRGVVTVTRYNQTPLADQILETIRNGDIKGQSFSGRFVKSNPEPPKYGFRADADGLLPTVTRTEVALIEYGPTPFPAYDEAAILGVRSALLRELITPEQLEELLALTHRADARFDHSTSEPVETHEPDPAGNHSERQWTPEQIARRISILEGK